MPSERIQRQIDALLDGAEAAVSRHEWSSVAEAARAVLAMDPANEDAPVLLRAAEANLEAPPAATSRESAVSASSGSPEPSSFAAGRYEVRKFLGEGGKKRVFLAHDELLDRDVAFAQIKTDDLDDIGRERILREAQAMGRMGTHPHIVSIFDFGEEHGAPYVVTELMGGGDVEGLLEKAGGALPIERTLELGKAVARGLVFAHAQGVVHRDLKPGNVWLTAEGVAKIGDFGLAVTEGRSRLTQHGMMVGTFAYMPPEQALGGEVTPRSDLYSLGAMLYELITGKPPFEADDATAVISQHLNASPVAPSWRSDHCPPALEDLILALLAKDPSARPASAAQVLATLDTIDAGEPSRPHSGDASNPLDRLARGVFVGRERELERLRTALDDAVGGRGSIVMLVGEPGIGKTRTVAELETYARMRGAQVLWGRAREAEGAPPYWPWLQVGRARGGSVDPAKLREQLGERAEELQRLFPELRRIFPDLAEPPPVSDAAAQFRLFDAFTSLYRELSAERPMVIVLDDLHWADRPTLQLLQHFAEEVAHSRILVVGTYRDTELSRTHPLSEALAELNRTAGFLRLSLRGLSRQEIAGYFEAVALRAPPQPLLARLYDETEGNPFFLSEVVNLLTEEGTLSADSVSDIAVPEGVKEALGRRLDRLSAEANELLATTAVVGREFEFEALQYVSGRAELELLALLEEALRARVVEETGRAGQYRFVHALMQETLLDELSATRRVRLHGEVGEALERRWGDSAEQHASELAVHYSEAATISSRHRERAAHYLSVAGDAAATSAAAAEAIRLYRSCLQLMDEAKSELGLDRAALLTALAIVERTGGEYVSANEHFRAAFGLYVERSAGTTAARVAVEWTRHGRLLATPGERSGIADRALALLPKEEGALRAELLAIRALDSSDELGVIAASEASALADELNLPSVRAILHRREAGRELESHGLGRALQAVEDAYSGFLAAGRDEAAIDMLIEAAQLIAPLGRLDDLVAHAARMRESARVGWASFIPDTLLSTVALLRCDWGNYWPTVERAMAAPGLYGFVNGMAEAWRTYIFGDPAPDAFPHPDLSSPEVPESYRSWIEACRALVSLVQGNRGAAAEALSEWSVHRRTASMALRLTGVGWAAQIAAELDELDLADAVYAEVNAWDEEYRVGGHSSMDAARGFLALQLDLVDKAARHFEVGLDWCRQERCPVEMGRCYQGLAEVAARQGDQLLAMEQLDRATELFAKHGAKLYLDQVIAKKQILKA